MAQIKEGIYSETKIQKIGTMNTVREQEIVDYYQCKFLDDNTMSIQILDIYGEPMPWVEKIPLDEFVKRFKFEPEKFQQKMTPKELATEKAIATAEHHVKRKEYNSAEFEYTKAIKLDEENVRANFGLGELYVITGDHERATEIFSKLSTQENILEPGNKHIFNKLGIELRRFKLYDQAIAFYQKALAVGTDDENLFFNVARAALEKGDTELGRNFLKKALDINPNFEEAKRYLAHFSAPGAPSADKAALDGDE